MKTGKIHLLGGVAALALALGTTALAAAPKLPAGIAHAAADPARKDDVAKDTTRHGPELLAFAESPLGRKYPATVAAWERAWERFTPFLAFPPEVRKIIYTTNAIESLNYQLRKIIKNRGHFPGDDAVIKLLWLAIRDIEDKRARDRQAEKGTPRGTRKAPARLVEGATVQGWKQALGALALHYPERLAPYIR